MWHFFYILFITPLCKFLAIGFQGNFQALTDELFPYLKFNPFSSDAGSLRVTELSEDMSIAKYDREGLSVTGFLSNMRYALYLPFLWICMAVFLLGILSFQKTKNIKSNRAYYNLRRSICEDGWKRLIQITYLPLTFNTLLCMRGLFTSEMAAYNQVLTVIFAIFYLVLFSQDLD